MKIFIIGVMTLLLAAACTSHKPVKSSYVGAIAATCGDLCK